MPQTGRRWKTGSHRGRSPRVTRRGGLTDSMPQEPPARYRCRLAAWSPTTCWCSSRARRLTGTGQRAIVVGCGLGADAEYIARLGYDTVAFDVAETAVRVARQRHPATRVDYVTTYLLNPPVARSRPSTWSSRSSRSRRYPTRRGGRQSSRSADSSHRAGRSSSSRRGRISPTPRSTGRRGRSIGKRSTRSRPTASVVRIEALADPRRANESRWRAEFRRPPPRE